MSRLFSPRPYRALAVLCSVAALPGIAGADSFPPMRPGLWQGTTVMHMNMAGQPPDTDNTPMVHYNCVDATSMAATMKLMTGFMKGCTTTFTGSGNTYVMSMACTNPEGLTGSINGTTTFVASGDTAVHVSGTSVGDLNGMKTSSDLSGDMKWVGACPAGVAPGDYGDMQNGVFEKKGSIFSPPG